MARYFRSCKQVTVGCGSAGFVTGVLVTLGLLLPIYDDIGVKYAKDSQKNNYMLTQGKTTQKFNIAAKKTSYATVMPQFSGKTTQKFNIAAKKTSNATEIPNVTCKLTKLGSKYRGNVNITMEGIPCQHWIDDKPHKRWKYYTIYTYPEDNFAAAKNYCRNPLKILEGPWCYTMDPDVRWQYCDIKMC